jgi:hypothetical protein
MNIKLRFVTIKLRFPAFPGMMQKAFCNYLMCFKNGQATIFGYSRLEQIYQGWREVSCRKVPAGEGLKPAPTGWFLMFDDCVN